MKMPSVMTHSFSQVPEAQIPRSSFDRTHGYKTTFNSGLLVPFYVDEVLPGDTFNVDATIFARLATPIVPFMDNLYLSTFYFFVPNRLVWDNFQKFMGEQADPDSSTDFLIPQTPSPAAGGWAIGSLADYFGLPTGITGLNANALFFRAYNLIWNEWFRDQNLQDSVLVPKSDGPDADTYYKVLRRNKAHDYFTSCLPWPQKGPAVALPLTGDAPVRGIGRDTTYTDYDLTNQSVYQSGDVFGIPSVMPIAKTMNTGQGYMMAGTNATSGVPDIYADLNAVAATTINELREAFQLQRLQERDARGGTRYTEILRAHFNVVSPDARLQRPEFLGGNKTPVIITPVQQTSASGAYADSPQGNLAAFGTVTSTREGFSKSFVEHGIVIGMLCVTADLTYQSSMPRMFTRRTKYDFYWPALAHLGEQAVLNREIFAQGTAVDDDVFGYQERWAEYRYYPSKITGQLRSSATTPLDVWHLSQEFSTLPTLSTAFIEENPPVDRVVAVGSPEPQFVMDSYLKCRTVRPMPVYSVPGLIDHF